MLRILLDGQKTIMPAGKIPTSYQSIQERKSNIMKRKIQFSNVYQAMNKFEAETIRLLLESFEIPVELIGESAGTSHRSGWRSIG